MLDNLSALVSVTLGGSVCILLFLAAGPLLSKHFTPRWRYCAWGVLAAVLILFQPFHATLPKSEDWSGLVQLSIPQAVSENAYDRENARNRDWEEIQKTGNGGRGAETENQDGERLRHSVQYENEAGQMVVIEDNDYVRKVTVGDETTYTVHWTGVAYGAYQAVAVLGVGFVLTRYFWSRRKLLRVSNPAGEEDQAALEAARRRTGCDREAELYRCSHIHTPMLMGFRRPVILLPADVPAGSLEAALAHELTHLKHRDTWYMLLMTLARCVHWFNPLVWLMVRTARRDMELYCDYDLLNGQGEEARRAYGRAILDQMTGRDRGFSGLTTGFSGSKKEVFARFRAIMDTDPKRKGRVVLVLAGTAVLLSGSLVGCQSPTIPDGRRMLAWVVDDSREDTVTCYPLDWFGPKELGAESRLLAELEEQGYESLGPAQQVPLAPDATFSCYMGNRTNIYPVIRSTLFATSGAGVGELCEITVEDGEITHLIRRGSLMAALSGDPMLDFTGYCGEVYAAGGVGGINTVSWDEESCWVDPCNDLGQDSDHTVYMLPLAEGCTIQEGLRAYTTGLSSGSYPDIYRLAVVDGAVTAIEGVWPEAENTVTLPIDPEEETTSNPENMPEHDPDFYGENGAEDMPEYDPGFYGESGAQPLEPSGSGTA